jgi:hypothetical protein
VWIESQKKRKKIKRLAVLSGGLSVVNGIRSNWLYLPALPLSFVT